MKLETRKKISNSLINYYKSLTEEQKEERRNKIKETYKRLYAKNRYPYILNSIV